MGATLPAAMAFASLALVLGFVPRRALWAMLSACGVAVAASRIAVPDAWTSAAFLGCWIAIVAIGALVYLPRPPGRLPTIAAAVVIGVAAGLVIGAAGDLLYALPATAIVVPASVAVALGHPIVPRVVASWLIAVALLAAIIPHAVTSPGYVPDHMG